MKVLVINGSPRAKENSDLLCDEFLQYEERAGKGGGLRCVGAGFSNLFSQKR